MRWLPLVVALAVGCSDGALDTAPVSDATATDAWIPDTRTTTDASEDTATPDTRTTRDASEDAATPDTTSAETSFPSDSADPDSVAFDTASAKDSSVAESATDARGDADSCNSVVQQGAAITHVSSTEAPPVFTGGAIADGTYVLTKWVAYGGSTVAPYTTRETIVVAGGSWQGAVDAILSTRFNAAVTTSGTTLTFASSCPTAGTVNYQYTATETEIVNTNDTANNVSWFTKL